MIVKPSLALINFENYREELEKALKEIQSFNIVSRIWKKDHTVWKPKDEEISNRLGWLDSPRSMTRIIPELKKFVKEIQEDGYTQTLLLGMGGASLAPEVFSQVFPAAKGHLGLKILDSTEPGNILKLKNSLDPERTLFVVSSKSGTTLETNSLLNFFFTWANNSLSQDQARKHFVAITDPHTPLEEIARDLNFRKIFYGDPTLGGRFSALSVFGLVPASLIGMNLIRLLKRVKNMARLCRVLTPQDNPGVFLGGVLATLAQAGRDKLTIVIPDALQSFAFWLEQLLAESTGKERHGLFPVVEGPQLSPEALGDDRVFIFIQMKKDRSLESLIERFEEGKYPLIKIFLQDIYDLGSQFFLWEMATAITGFFLRINPFDQPDVALSKKKTEEVLKFLRIKGCLPREEPSLEANGLLLFSEIKKASLEESLKDFFSQAQPRDYIAIQAFIEPTPETAGALLELKKHLEKRTRLAVNFGFGPRFLHSTGQLHKGDNGNGLFIQLTSDSRQDLPIPDKPGSSLASLSFAMLLAAQARGDWEALKERGRRIIRLHLGQNVLEGLKRLCSSI